MVKGSATNLFVAFRAGLADIMLVEVLNETHQADFILVEFIGLHVHMHYLNVCAFLNTPLQREQVT